MWDTRHELILDVGLMLWRRAVLADHLRSAGGGTARYGMADSSPQGHRNWLQSISFEISVANIAECSNTMMSLTADELEREDDRPHGDTDGSESDGGDEPILRRPRLDRPFAFAKLRRFIRAWNHVPVALGIHHDKLEDKISALLHSWYLEAGSLSQVPSCRVPFN